MADPHQLLAFCAVTFVLVVIPGPSVLFIVGRALAHGRRAALASVLGNWLGSYLLVVAVALGVGTLVERSVLLFTAVKLAGAGYLVWLGVKAVRANWGRRAALAHALAEHAPAARETGFARQVREGFLVGATNPKSIVFFSAMLPQFVDRQAGGVVAQMLLLGLAGTLLALLTDVTWGLAASAARDWFGRSPRRMRAVGGTGGLAMIGLGATVAVTGRAE
ncbi:LysE family translocator [Streptomyces sp. NPDC101118]|uniref:LysE family translocator n=1 Tax=Streptomyces sp. NPDC101118 TaxID=3366109 RepID=UPI00382AEE42